MQPFFKTIVPLALTMFAGCAEPLAFVNQPPRVLYRIYRTSSPASGCAMVDDIVMPRELVSGSSLRQPRLETYWADLIVPYVSQNQFRMTPLHWLTSAARSITADPGQFDSMFVNSFAQECVQFVGKLYQYNCDVSSTGEMRAQLLVRQCDQAVTAKFMSASR